MGINKTNLGVSIESVRNFIKTIAGTHNSIPGRDIENSHPISAITGLQDKMNIIDDISVAQKTINTRGIKELLNSKIIYPISVATTNGSPAFTTINADIPLNESIENYNMLSVQFAVDSTYKFKSELNMLNVPEIVYNNANTYSPSDGSVLFLMDNVTTSVTNSWGGAHMSIRAWFKSPTVMHIDGVNNPFGISQVDKVSIISIKGLNVENVTIDPVEYVNATQGIEDTPVGNIMSVMGRTAPSHYLICDGSVHNITDFPYLSQYIKDQFGNFNYFGGDGTTTFAVPDLRNEFLRGYHGDKTEKQSGEIGVHQEPTNHINFYVDQGSHIFLNGDYNKYVSASNVDKAIYTSNLKGWTNNGSLSTWVAGGDTKYTSRPTNTAVLYCIKYEPTYFMSIQGMIEEITLWEGNMGTTSGTMVSNSIALNDSYKNYDNLGIYYIGYSSTDSNTQHPGYREIPQYMLNYTRNTSTPATITLDWGYNGNPDYTTILKTSTDSNLNIIQSYSKLIKVVGIKYKTFQN